MSKHQPLTVNPDLQRCMELLVEIDQLVVKVFEERQFHDIKIPDYYFAVDQIDQTTQAIGRLIRNEVLYRSKHP